MLCFVFYHPKTPRLKQELYKRGPWHAAMDRKLHLRMKIFSVYDFELREFQSVPFFPVKALLWHTLTGLLKIV